MMKLLITALVVFVFVLIMLSSFLFTVDETEHVVVQRFGEIRRVIDEPGLYFKQPFIENITRFDKRIQLYDIPTERIYTMDKKTLLVDTYAMWRIEDAELFVMTMRTVNNALTRLDDVVYSNVRNVFGKVDFDDIISEKRSELLEIVTDQARAEVKQFGIDLVSVRVKRADLPDENKEAVFERMRSERIREAGLIRAEGEREATEIRAEADKEAQLIIAEATKQAQILRGQGDADALTIFASAYSQDPEFFEFLKRMEVYETSLIDSVFVLTPEMEFIERFLSDN
ncbi:MAG: Membrane protease subunit, stomatin/prohibitin [Thermotogales bacterium 46_20]|nr:MAG: Membrane protease subunit, stomatin/prohibitin [Thermotogales bacterium 46_20]